MGAIIVRVCPRICRFSIKVSLEVPKTVKTELDVKEGYELVCLTNGAFIY